MSFLKLGYKKTVTSILVFLSLFLTLLPPPRHAYSHSLLIFPLLSLSLRSLSSGGNHLLCDEAALCRSPHSERPRPANNNMSELRSEFPNSTVKPSDETTA